VAEETIVWPGPDSSVPMYRYSENESPDPLAGCPGYRGKVGLPLLVHRSQTTEISSARISEVGGVALQLCVLTAGTFHSNDSSLDKSVSFLLREEAIIIPKSPLKPGSFYDVSLVFTDGETKAWRFGASKDDQIHLPPTNPFSGVRTPGIALQPATQKPAVAPSTKTKPTKAKTKTAK
jgi:hypothetical protein